MDHLNKEI